MSLADRLSHVSGVKEWARPGAAREAEARLDDYALLKQSVYDRLVERLGARLYGGDLDRRMLNEVVFDVIEEAMAEQNRPLSAADRARVVQEIIDGILGVGPLEPLLRDPEISEIMVNRYNRIFVERAGRIEPTHLRFADERHLREIIDRIVSRVGRRVDEASPTVDARLPDGSRVNAVVPPIAVDGASLTIRKFAREAYTSKDLVRVGTVTEEALGLLEACVKGKLNVLISGGTGSGKTTTLNVLSSFVPDDERIITIEDAAELQLAQPHVLRLESRPPNIEGAGEVTIRDLVQNSLRMRPDRIIVGEVRGPAALDMLQAMNTGHEGSLTTVHANSPLDALSRVETMVLMAGLEIPVVSIRQQVASALDLIVHQMRLRDGSRHITHISEVAGVVDGSIVLEDLFTFRYHRDPGLPDLGTLVSEGRQPGFTERLLDRGVELDPGWFRRP
ncbi:MAG: CpaF family protein [Actinomycetota bacterium]|nr:CpaF family protein [Actinomycetota bacterium]